MIKGAKAVAVIYIAIAFILMARDLDVPGFSQGLGAGLGASVAVLYLLLQDRPCPLAFLGLSEHKAQRCCSFCQSIPKQLRTRL